MKRLALIIVLGIVAVNVARRHSEARQNGHARDAHRAVHVVVHHVDGDDDWRDDRGRAETDAVVLTALEQDQPEPPTPPRPPAPARKPKAPKAKPAAAPKKAPKAAATPVVTREVVGRLSATEERAKTDAHVQLKAALVEWLDRDVPTTWPRLQREADRLIVETRVDPEVKDYGTVYRAKLQVDFSPARRAQIVERYRREVVLSRLVKLGGGLAFSLVCLATLAGYIRADEATKGYYTNRLRLAAAAGVGAAGAALYHVMA